MTIQEALSILRPETHTMEAVKAAYRAMAKQFHPDVNSHGLEMMKLINAAFDVLCDQFNSWTLYGFEPDDTPVHEAILAVFEKIKHCIGINAEVCGTWLWITGNTRIYKDVFKACGMKWSQISWLGTGTPRETDARGAKFTVSMRFARDTVAKGLRLSP